MLLRRHLRKSPETLGGGSGRASLLTEGGVDDPHDDRPSGVDRPSGETLRGVDLCRRNGFQSREGTPLT